MLGDELQHHESTHGYADDFACHGRGLPPGQHGRSGQDWTMQMEEHSLRDVHAGASSRSMEVDALACVDCDAVAVEGDTLSASRDKTVCLEEKVLAELVESRELLSPVSPERVLNLSARFCLEVFSGVGVLTLGLVFARLPCLRPWDSLNGPDFDVLAFGQVILELALRGRLAYVHLAPPCQSMSFGRLPPQVLVGRRGVCVFVREGPGPGLAGKPVGRMGCRVGPCSL